MSDKDSFQFFCILTFVVVGFLTLLATTVRYTPDKIYTYDVDFYENLTITEKEID